MQNQNKLTGLSSNKIPQQQSFTRSFYQILATLWPIDDSSTAFLMSEFYRQLAHSQAESGNKVTKALALQRAQIALWNHQNQDWKRPYFWAAYVLIGNWI